MISGLFFGFSFAMGALGAAVLGWIAERSSIETVYKLCAFLPAIRLLAAFLPSVEETKRYVSAQQLCADSMTSL